MLDKKIIDSLREISIRGRLAYGASCLENALRSFDVKNDLFEKEVLSRIWAFTSSSDLSEWDKSVTEIDPGDYSPFSLNPLERVIIKCISLQIELPQLEPFKKSRYTEDHGWGIERDKGFFVG